MIPAHDPTSSAKPGFLTWIRRASLLGFFSILGIPEVLSLLGRVERPSYLILLACLGGGGCIVFMRWPAILPRRPRLEPGDSVWLLLIGSILMATLSTALFWPPNNWDSMTYHLPRVDQWIQNRSIALFPTGNLRQTLSPPLAELGILLSIFVAGGDWLANTVQWIGFCICIIAAMEAVALLGGGRSTQWASGCIVATLPMALLQSSSTQNDLLASVFLLSTAVEVLHSCRKTLPSSVFWVGLSAGLGLATKGTLLLYLPPLLILWLHGQGAASIRQILVRTAIAIALAISIATPHAIRTFRSQGTFLPTTPGQAVDRISFASIASNGFRNAAIHLQIPHFLPRWLTWNPLTESFARMHQWTELDPVSPATTFDVNFRPFHAREAWAHEDYSGNSLHFLLLVAASPLLLLKRGQPQSPSRIAWTIAAIGGALLLTILLKWQAWGSRLHLPLFALAIPALTVGIPIRVLRPTCILLWAMSWFWIGNNFLRPMPPPRYFASLPREALRFMAKPSLYQPTSAVADIASKSACDEMGLLLSGDDWEYPLVAMIRDRANRPVNFRHILGNGSHAPCLAIGTLDQIERFRKPNDGFRADTLSPFVILHQPSERIFAPNP